MSIAVMTHVWKHSASRSGDLIVLLAIADWADDYGVAFPSHTALAVKARLGPRQVRRSIDRLVEMGELRVDVNQGRRGTNLYKILRGGVVSEDQGVVSEDQGGEGLGDQGMEGLDDQGGRVSMTRGHVSGSVIGSVIPSGGAAAAATSTAAPLVAHFMDTLTARGVTQIPKNHPARVGREVKKLLEDEIDEGLIRRAVELVAERNLPPTAIAYLVMEAQAPSRHRPQRRYGRGMTSAEIGAMAAQLRKEGR